MFGLLLRKELLDQLLSLRFALACILCLTVTLSSALVWSQAYQAARADYQTNLVMHKNEIKAVRDLIRDGLKIDQPVNPLQVLFQGMAGPLTTTTQIHAHREAQVEATDQDNPVGFLFPAVDLFFFIGVVLSLLALAFSYDAIAGEKEQATLKLLMSYAVPRDQVLLAKWVGGYLALATPLILSLLAGLIVFLLSPSMDLTALHGGALGLIVGLALLYLAAIYSLGMCISACTHQASTAITILLMGWALLILVIPNMAPYLAKPFQPVDALSGVYQGQYAIEVDERQHFAEALNQWDAANPNPAGNQRWATEEALRQAQYERQLGRQAKIDEAFHHQMNAQVRLGQALSRLSPLASFAYAGSDLAGTGLGDRHRFGQQLRDYRQQILHFGYQARLEAIKKDAWGERTIEGYPVFGYEESRLSDRISWVDILLLGSWTILFYLGAYLAFLRYDVT